MGYMRELIVGEITIKMMPNKVTFSSTVLDKNSITTFDIPSRFRDKGIEFYDLYLEQGYPTVFLACRDNYDVAIYLDVRDGKMVSWHYTK